MRKVPQAEENKITNDKKKQKVGPGLYFPETAIDKQVSTKNLAVNFTGCPKNEMNLKHADKLKKVKS